MEEITALAIMRPQHPRDIEFDCISFHSRFLARITVFSSSIPLYSIPSLVPLPHTFHSI